MLALLQEILKPLIALLNNDFFNCAYLSTFSVQNENRTKIIKICTSMNESTWCNEFLAFAFALSSSFSRDRNQWMIKLTCCFMHEMNTKAKWIYCFPSLIIIVWKLNSGVRQQIPSGRNISRFVFACIRSL